MQNEYFFVGAAIIGSIIGTYTDIKGRWVPDYVGFFMVFFGLGGHALVSILEKNFLPILYSAVGAGVFLGIGLIMYYSGVWGGGDAKMLLGLGALLPTFKPFVSAPWPFLATLWLNLLVFGAIFGVLASAWLAVKNKEKFSKEFKNLFYGHKLRNIFFMILLPLSASLSFFNFRIFAFLPVAVFFLWLAFPFLKAVENACMHKKIMPSQLTEGDWIAEEIKISGFVYKPEKEGISKENIMRLVELEKKGKIKDILVKEGIPYVPALLAGLLASVFYGDLIFVAVRMFL